MSLDCAHGQRCGGCPWIGRPLRAQQADKLAQLLALAAGPLRGALEAAVSAGGLHSLGEGGLRDRADLRLEGGRLGLWSLDGAELVDLSACPMMSPALAGWFEQVRADLPPVARAGLRLRVSPSGAQGLWLDLANLDTKALLDEGAWLRRAAERAVIELGQRRKRLTLGEPLRLGNPELLPWFETWLSAERPTPLFGPVGGFSQPSLAGNRVLVGLIRDLAVAVGERLRARGLPQRWLEYGAGNGNLTLPLAAVSEGVAALEVDPLAIAGLAQGAAAAGLTDKVRVLRRAEPAPAALVDPPRAGLGPFLPELLRLAPEELLYVSCHGPALVGDLGPLWEAGYRPRRLTGVDSFPQSPHAEWVLWLSRGSAEGGDGA